jgi:hypothetical protein
MKKKEEIELQFINDIRTFTLHPENSKKTLLQIIEDYNNAYKNIELENKRNFNSVIFSHLFTKVRTIGFSKNITTNQDFILYRKLLIQEVNLKNPLVAKYFAIIISDNNIHAINKGIYYLIYTAFSHYVEIFNNLHQYKINTVNTNIRIAKTYIADLQKYKLDNEFKASVIAVDKFISELIIDDKLYLTTAST